MASGLSLALLGCGVATRGIIGGTRGFLGREAGPLLHAEELVSFVDYRQGFIAISGQPSERAVRPEPRGARTRDRRFVFRAFILVLLCVALQGCSVATSSGGERAETAVARITDGG